MSHQNSPVLIPTVDISSFLTNPLSKEAELVVSEIKDACMAVGFFQIIGHGISPDLQEVVFEGAKSFFSLPQEIKEHYVGSPGRGYELIGTQALDPSTKPDLKEVNIILPLQQFVISCSRSPFCKGYFVGRDVPNRQPPYRNFEYPNVWPTQIIPDAQFKDPILKYHDAICNLAYQVMKILARGLANLNTQILEDFCHEPIASVRLLHYPPHPASDDPRLVGAGAHTDFGAITLLLQEDGSGLQVKAPENDEWIDIPPQKGAYVVNVGDMLERWTSGRYKSTIHRVINTSGKDRYSVPFFFDGNLDFLLKPLDSPSEKGITVEQHMRSRYMETSIS